MPERRSGSTPVNVRVKRAQCKWHGFNLGKALSEPVAKKEGFEIWGCTWGAESWQQAKLPEI